MAIIMHSKYHFSQEARIEFPKENWIVKCKQKGAFKHYSKLCLKQETDLQEESNLTKKLALGYLN